MSIIREVEKEFMKKDVPDFKVGDIVKVSVKIKEGDKTRLQAYEGIVISKRGSGTNETFTVRRISFGEGVERIFQVHSPNIDSIQVVKKGRFKRARLYYLRGKVGKHTKVEEERAFEKQQNAELGEESVS